MRRNAEGRRRGAHGAEIKKLETSIVRVMDEHADRVERVEDAIEGLHRMLQSALEDKWSSEEKRARGKTAEVPAEESRRWDASDAREDGERARANVAVVGSNRVKIVHRVGIVRGETTDAAMLERNA